MESSLNLWVSCSIIIGQSRITHRSSSNSSSLTKTRNPYHNRFKHVSNCASFNKFSCLTSQWLWYNILFCGDRNKKLTFFFFTFATTVLLLYIFYFLFTFQILMQSFLMLWIIHTFFRLHLELLSLHHEYIHVNVRNACACHGQAGYWNNEESFFFFVNIYLTSSNTLIFKLKIKTPINIINDVISQ